MFSKTILIGHLGKDAELKFTGTGKAVVNFSMATNRKWKNQAGETQTETDWHKIVFWGTRGEKLHPYLLKGKLVCVEGRYYTRKWQDRDGNDRYTSEVNLENITLLGGGGERREESQAQSQPEQTNEEPWNTSSDADDDIPF